MNATKDLPIARVFIDHHGIKHILIKWFIEWWAIDTRVQCGNWCEGNKCQLN